MKKNIIALLVFSCLGGTAFAQTNAQQELRSYMKEGLVRWQSADNRYSFRIGGRVMLDGSHYFDDFTDRSSGVQFSEARVRLFSTIGSAVDFKFEIDFAPSGVTLKDVYFRWHTNPNGFVKFGNFVEPFSAENIQSGFDDRFINKSATFDAFNTGRTLGVSYRYYHPYFWGEAGIFSQAYNSLKSYGDMGYGLSTRLLGRYTNEDFNIHAGGSLNFRRPNGNGFTNGSDDFNRYVIPSSSLESSVDQTPMLGGRIDNVKNSFKYALELMANYRMFYITGEFINAKYERERDWEYNFRAIQGTFTSTIAPTLERYKALLGGDPSINLKGYSVQAGWMIFGGNYEYNHVEALMDRPGPGSLELVVRYNHTDLNDVIGGSLFYNGRFYSSSLLQSFGIPNGSYSGGTVDTYTIGLNYSFTRNIMVKLNYGYQKLDQRYNFTYNLDKDMHSIQARLAFEF